MDTSAASGVNREDVTINMLLVSDGSEEESGHNSAEEEPPHSHHDSNLLMPHSKFISSMRKRSARHPRFSSIERRTRLEQAIEAIRNERLSIRQAAVKFDLAKSSVCDYVKKNGLTLPTTRGRRPRNLQWRQLDKTVSSSADHPVNIPILPVAWKEAEEQLQGASSSSSFTGKATSVCMSTSPVTLKETTTSLVPKIESGTRDTEDLLHYLTQSTSAEKGLQHLKATLITRGFREVDAANWKVELGSKVFFSPDQQSMFVAAVGGQYECAQPWAVAVAGLDSPLLKIKPASAALNETRYLAVPTHGTGSDWSQWLNVQLSLAGKVIIQQGDALLQRHVEINRPFLTLTATKRGMEVNFSTPTDHKEVGNILLRVLAHELAISAQDIVDFDLFCWQPTMPVAVHDKISGSTLASSMAAYVTVHGLLHSLDTTDLSQESGVRLLYLHTSPQTTTPTPKTPHVSNPPSLHPVTAKRLSHFMERFSGCLHVDMGSLLLQLSPFACYQRSPQPLVLHSTPCDLACLHRADLQSTSVVVVTQCGTGVLERALLKKLAETGSTTLQMIENLDTTGDETCSSAELNSPLVSVLCPLDTFTAPYQSMPLAGVRQLVHFHSTFFSHYPRLRQLVRPMSLTDEV